MTELKKQKLTFQHDNYLFSDEIYLKILSHVQYDAYTIKSVSVACKLFNSLSKDNDMIKVQIYNEVLDCKIPFGDLVKISPLIEDRKDNLVGVWLIDDNAAFDISKFIETAEAFASDMEVENTDSEARLQFKDVARYGYGRISLPKIYGKNFFKSFCLVFFRNLVKFLKSKSKNKSILFTNNTMVLYEKYEDGMICENSILISNTTSSIIQDDLPKPIFDYNYVMETYVTSRQMSKLMGLIGVKDGGVLATFTFIQSGMVVSSVNDGSSITWTVKIPYTKDAKLKQNLTNPVKNTAINKYLKLFFPCLQEYDGSDVSVRMNLHTPHPGDEAYESEGIIFRKVLKNGNVLSFFVWDCRNV